jgi:hypothetical protein
MSRPALEWPIPVYVSELRERLILVFRVPAEALEEAAPAPVLLEARRGVGVVALALSRARCLKSVGAHPVLAGECHTAELLAPARRQGACRPAVRGSYLLGFQSDRASLNRLVARCLECPPAAGCPGAPTRVGARQVWAEESEAGWEVAFTRPNPAAEAPWPAGSAFPDFEAAEAALLHPEAVFTTAPGGGAVWAFPVHHYARSTSPAVVDHWSADWIRRRLGLRSGDLALDHSLFQRRCTHQWAFPPERIPAARGCRSERPAAAAAIPLGRQHSHP